MTQNSDISIAVVIPCYRVTAHIEGVITAIGPEVDHIFCVDDHCPNESGKFIDRTIHDDRVSIIYHEQNQGVGGATISGYKAAIENGADIVVKLDGDGQMDPSLIGGFVGPIIDGNADYTKGNRFFRTEDLRGMPCLRLIGNALLSFVSKFSTGYWNLFDPANGFTAIHRYALENLPLEKISHDFFFESDMLFRLNTLGAVTIDIPLPAQYGDEVSNLKIPKIMLPFLTKHVVNFLKRVAYNYYVRDFNIASLLLPLGILLFVFGVVFGIDKWMESSASGVPATAGTVMIAAISTFAGLQFLLGVLNFDIRNTPTLPLQKRQT